MCSDYGDGIKSYRFEDFAKNGGAIAVNECFAYQGEEKHRHDFFELIFIKDGAGYYEENNITEPISAGDVILADSGSVHSLTPVSSNFSWLNILFKPDMLWPEAKNFTSSSDLLFLEQFGEKTECIPGSMIIVSGRGDKFRNIVNDMAIEFRQGEQKCQKILMSELFMLLCRIKRYLTGERIRMVFGYTAESLIKIVDTFFPETSSWQPILLEDAARLANVTPKYFSRLFKEKTGVSFIDYVQNRRLEAAELLLRISDASVQSVMENVGCRDCKTFYRRFNEKYGMTPYRYKMLAHKADKHG